MMTRILYLLCPMLLIVATPARSMANEEAWLERSENLRRDIRKVLTLPESRIPLNAETHRTTEGSDYSIHSLSYASELGSRVTALLYLPKPTSGRVPGIIVACGHGGSKSCFYAQYAGQLYAKLGFACFIPDTIGEEEREASGRMGARGHDLYPLKDTNPEFVRTRLKRSVLGKIVWDLMRGIDYMETRPEIDPDRIGLVGYSLGGATGGCVSLLDERVRAAVLCGWAFRARYAVASKYCTRLPYASFERMMRFDEMTALLAPHTATLFMCGTKDAVIDSDLDGAAVVAELSANIEGTRNILTEAGIEGTIEAEFVPGAGHRPFFLSHRAAGWLQDHLAATEGRRPVPVETIPFGEWVDSQGHKIEELYNTERNERGLHAVDCGAILRTPKELACFPDRETPASEYTMMGWTDAVIASLEESGPPAALRRWMGPQEWTRDSDGPVISLGDAGTFEDTHLFAPAVAYENGTFSMLYCGSRGRVQERVFRLGLAVSTDGIRFEKSDLAPVYSFGDDKQSVLTPTFLRGDDGRTVRDDGLLRLWFTTADLTTADSLHVLRESTGRNVDSLAAPSAPQLENAYAPTVILDGDVYRVWYADVSVEPWSIRHAWSRDGREWTATEGPVVVIDQEWERDRLFYPTVLKSDGVYLMWYGAYWKDRTHTTAIGCAASEDGIVWHKLPQNPVLRPDPARNWESHYTTSQSVMHLEDGTWRIWYATRKEPPHVNKYFAIGTASWPGPD